MSASLLYHYVPVEGVLNWTEVELSLFNEKKEMLVIHYKKC